MKQFTEQEAIKLGESKFYEDLTAKEIVAFQLYQDKLCMPFDVFHKAITEALDRPVYTHEFVDYKRLRLEFEGRVDKPTLEDIINIIPKEKRILIGC
jgi:hypothetical protein